VVTTVSSYTDARNRALVGDGFDGVVRVVVGNTYGTGVLLFDGTAVLTAAHLFTQTTRLNNANVVFETRSGTQTIASSQVLVHPNYDSANSNNDLAIVWLSQDAPLTAERYGIYRASDEIGKTISLVGYGIPGSGAAGTLTPFNQVPLFVSHTLTSDSAINTRKLLRVGLLISLGQILVHRQYQIMGQPNLHSRKTA